MRSANVSSACNISRCLDQVQLDAVFLDFSSPPPSLYSLSLSLSLPSMYSYTLTHILVLLCNSFIHTCTHVYSHVVKSYLNIYAYIHTYKQACIHTIAIENFAFHPNTLFIHRTYTRIRTSAHKGGYTHSWTVLHAHEIANESLIVACNGLHAHLTLLYISQPTQLHAPSCLAISLDTHIYIILVAVIYVICVYI